MTKHIRVIALNLSLGIMLLPLGAGSVAAQCELNQNPGFHVDLSGWETVGNEFDSIYYTEYGRTAGSGSVWVHTAGDDDRVVLRQCVAVAPGLDHALSGYAVRTNNYESNSPAVRLRVVVHDQPACAGSLTQSFSTDRVYLRQHAAFPAAWQPLTANVTTPAWAQSALIEVESDGSARTGPIYADYLVDDVRLDPEVPNLSLGLERTPANPDPGGSVTVSLEVTNNGSAPSSATEVALSLPSQLSYSGTGACDGSVSTGGGGATWSAGAVGAGTTSSCDVNLLVGGATPAGSVLSASAAVSHSGAACTPNDDTGDFEVAVATTQDLALDYEVMPDATAPGGLVRVRMTLENLGNAASPLGAFAGFEAFGHLDLIDAYRCRGSIESHLDGQEFHWYAGELAQGESTTCLMTYRLSESFSGSSLSMLSFIAGPYYDDDLGNNGTTETLTVGTPSVFTVDWLFDSVDADPGDGVCEDDQGYCTLRAAVMEANALPGPNVIELGPTDLIPHLLTLLESGTDASGGDLDITDSVHIVGTDDEPSEVYADFPSGSRDRLIEVHPGAAAIVTLENVILDNGDAVEGGGVYQGASDGLLRLDRTTIRDCTAEDGGGLYSHGDVEIVESVLLNNGATGDGGGLALVAEAGSGRSWIRDSRIAGNTAGNADTGGGGFVLFGTVAPVVIFEGATLSGNQAGYGGGVGLGGALVFANNSTISGNRALARGGGVFAGFTGGVRLNHSTVAFNTADPDDSASGEGGGVHIATGGSVSTACSVITDNSALNGPIVFDSDCSGELETHGWNVVGLDASCSMDVALASDTDSGGGFLLALADNGGPTATHALAPGAVAIDHSPGPNGCSFDHDGDQQTLPVTAQFDQRGGVRIGAGAGAAADAGSFEDGADFVSGDLFSDGFESGDTTHWSASTP